MSLQQNLEQETVSQLNLREAITISPDKTIRDAVEEMRKKKLGCVVVIDNERKPIGLYTEAMLRVAICREPESIDAVLSEPFGPFGLRLGACYEFAGEFSRTETRLLFCGLKR